jgi:predicted  nucleic acid-binding Zn-ribbon protein
VVLCSFIKQYLNASNADEVEHLKAELETVKQEKAQLEKELAELKVR